MYYKDEYLIEMMSRTKGFVKVPTNYHIIGVRSSADAPDKFDDVFTLFHGTKSVITTTGTTNPGSVILQGGFLKYNKDGAAILESNRIYYNVWQYGKHLGKTPALLQLGNKVAIWRDGNKNNKSEEIGKREEGYFGINFHCDQYDVTAPDKASDNIGGWSAGCQVLNKLKDYNEIIRLCKPQKGVTYTLLNEFGV